MLFIKKRLLPILLCFTACVAESRRPFNYKAFESKKKGIPLITYKPIEKNMPSEYLKVVPSWPAKLRMPNPDDQGLSYSEAGFGWANWGFDSICNAVDPSQMLFGGKAVTIGDVSIIARMHDYSVRDMAESSATDNSRAWISRTAEDPSPSDAAELAELGQITGSGVKLSADFRANKRFLAFLASKELVFKSKMLEPFFNFSYQSPVFGGDVAVGITIPVIWRFNYLDMIHDLAPLDNNVLSLKSNFSGSDSLLQDFFFAKYPQGYSAFYKDMLDQKDLSTDVRSSRFGIGDVEFNVSKRVKSDYITQALFGASVVIPSATQGSKKHPWPATLGNNGFWEVRPYASAYWQQSRLMNFHLMGEYQFVFSNSAEYRVSRLIDFNAVSRKATVNAKALPFGENLIFANHNFSGEPESKIPAFSEGPLQTVEFKPGDTIKFRVGNIFDEVGTNRGYLDVYYDLLYKFSDRQALRFDGGSYDVNALTLNSERWSQSMSATYAYRLTDNVSLEAKGSHVFSGKNILKKSSLSLALQIRT